MTDRATRPAVDILDAETKRNEHVTEEEYTAEETKNQLRMHEEDFIQGLIDAAAFSTEEETQKIEIARGGRVYFAFRIRPLRSDEYEACRKKHTKSKRNRQLGITVADTLDRVRYQSEIIYQATVEEDRKKLWDNRKVWDGINARKDQIINGLDVIGCVLKPGEKDKVLDAIDKLSGYEEDLEDVAKN